MTAKDAMTGFFQEQARRRSFGLRMDGRYCLACGKPLFGPELLHEPPPGPMSIVDKIRWAGEAAQV